MKTILIEDFKVNKNFLTEFSFTLQQQGPYSFNPHEWMQMGLHDTDYKNFINCSHGKMTEFLLIQRKVGNILIIQFQEIIRKNPKYLQNLGK